MNGSILLRILLILGCLSPKLTNHLVHLVFFKVSSSLFVNFDFLPCPFFLIRPLYPCFFHFFIQLLPVAGVILNISDVNLFENPSLRNNKYNNFFKTSEFFSRDMNNFRLINSVSFLFSLFSISLRCGISFTIISFNVSLFSFNVVLNFVFIRFLIPSMVYSMSHSFFYIILYFEFAIECIGLDFCFEYFYLVFI